jgi:hypothetical protein
MIRRRADEERGFPILEIPEGMFDAQVCAAMELQPGVAVS